MSTGRRGSGERSGRILVTGAAGFIGSHLCERLLEDGYRIWGLDNFDPYYDPEIKRRNLTVAARSNAFRLVEGDVRDEVLLEGLFSDIPFDAVVHLAARPGVQASFGNAREVVRTNIGGTTELLDAMRRHKVLRLIFASSASVYDGSEELPPYSERQQVPLPHSPYAATKLAGELLCHASHCSWNLSVYCLRMFSVYGPRQRPDLAVHKFARRIDEGEAVLIHGTGHSGRDYTYVGDVVEAYARIFDRLQAETSNDSTFNVLNVGTGQAIATTDLVGAISRTLEKPSRIRSLPARGDGESTSFADTTQIMAQLDFVPSVGLEDGLRDFVKWLQAETEYCGAV